MKNQRLIYGILIGIILISILSLYFVLAGTTQTILEKDLYKDKYQIINTENIVFDLPVYATHYWTDSKGNNDLYEVIISNFSIKGDKDYILRVTWKDERYISESLQIHYEFKNGELDKNSIKLYSLSKYDKGCMDNLDTSLSSNKYQNCEIQDKSKLRFKNINIEIGTLTGYETRKEIINDSEINVKYPTYSWKPYSNIITNIAKRDFIAVDDVNVSACGTLGTANEVYNLNQSIIVTGTCMLFTANNITFNMRGYNLTSTIYAGQAFYIMNNVNGSTIMNGSIEGVDWGIYYYYPGEYNHKVKDLTIKNTGSEAILTSGGGAGDNCGNFNFTNLYIESPWNRGFDFRCDDSYFNNITINLTLYEAIDLLGSGNTFTNIFLYNIDDAGLDLGSTANNNTFTNIFIDNITDTNYEAVYISYADNNYFKNLKIVNSEVTNQIYLRNTAINNTFVNSTYNASKVTIGVGSELIRKWYFSPQVNYTNGTAVNNTNLTAWNVLGTIIKTEQTDSKGQTSRWELTEYVNTGTKSYYTNYTINATKTGWDTNSTQINLTTNTLNQQFDILDTIVPTVTIAHPQAQIYSYNESLPLNYSVSDLGVGLDSCWYKIDYSNGTNFLSNTTLTSCSNITFNVSISEIYDLTLYVNDTENNVNLSSVTFSVSLESPAVVLNYPTDNKYFNNGNNIYFNFTATDSDNLDTCHLYGNWTGTWHKNYTWKSPTNATMNWTQINLTEGKYNWNVWCNDTNGLDSWALNNFSLNIDLTNPTSIINSVGTAIGSKIISFNSSNSDNYGLDSCKYSIYNSGGTIDGVTENISFTCTNQVILSTVSDYDAYTLRVYVKDLADNEIYSTKIFAVQSSGASPGGGGGTLIEGEPEPDKTFCGDNICQSEGNDYGLRENFWSCPNDCRESFNFDELFYSLWKYCFDDPSLNTLCLWTQGFSISEFEPEIICGDGICSSKESSLTCSEDCGKPDFDSFFMNCIDSDENTICFWRSYLSYYLIFGIGALILILFIVQIDDNGERKTVGKYVVLKTKKRYKRYRKKYKY